jgi:hypothetical protein
VPTSLTAGALPGTIEPLVDQPAPTSILQGRYRLLRVLPAEPTGERYLGVARAMPTRALFIKRIPESLARNRPTVSRFLDEARTTARLRHPAIPAVLDVGEDAGTFVAVFEHLPGVDASELLEALAARRERLPQGMAVRLISVVLEALAHAHAAVDEAGQPMELVHRDVSAASVRVGYDGQVRLGGFGLAKQKEQSAHTSFGVIRGQLAYVAPEQLVPGEIDARVDLWAAGVLLYELLTGARPFERPAEFHILKAIREEQPQPPSTLRPELSPGLDAFIARALTKDRQARFQTAAQMREALLACVPAAESSALAAQVTALFAGALGSHRGTAQAGTANLQAVLTLAGGVPTAAEVARDVEPDDEPSETGRVFLQPATDPMRSPLATSDPSQPALTPSVPTDPQPSAPMPEAPPRVISRGVRPPARRSLPAPRPPSRPEVPRARRKRRFRLVTERGIHPAIHPLVAVVAVLLALGTVRRAHSGAVVVLAPLTSVGSAVPAVVPAQIDPAPRVMPEPPVPEPTPPPPDAELTLAPDVPLASVPGVRAGLDRHQGQLRIDAPRRTRILVDGRAVSTPLTLAPGLHQLRVVLPGGVVHEETLRIDAGKTVRRAFNSKVVPPQPARSHWP